MDAEYTAERRQARRRIRMRNGFDRIEPLIWRDNPVWQEMEAIQLNGCSTALSIEIEWLKNRFAARGQQIVRYNWVWRYFYTGTRASEQERITELEGIAEQIWHSDNMINSAITNCRMIMDSEAMVAAAHQLDANRSVKDLDLLLGDERDAKDRIARVIANT